MTIDILKKGSSKQRFVERGIYFVTKGDHQGAFILNIKEFDTEDTKAILMMPELQKTTIPKNKIKELFQDSAVEYVETIPKHVYSVCLAQYKVLK
jgi:hypothetical protein